MSTLRTFPDAEAMATTILRAADPTIPVFTELPYDGEVPFRAVRRIGGTPPVRRALDAADIQVDVWHATKAEAYDAAVAARVALHTAEGTTVAYSDGSGFITGVDDATGLAWLPDPANGRERYTFTVRLYTR